MDGWVDRTSSRMLFAARKVIPSDRILLGREEVERVFSRLSSGRRFSDSSRLRGLLRVAEDFCSGFFCKPKRKDFNDYALGEKCNKTKTASLGCWKLCK